MAEIKIHFPAEWAAQDAVAIAFPHENSDWAGMLEQVSTVFIEIIETIALFEDVIVICDNIEQVKRKINADFHEKIHFFEILTNDTWARDFMPLTVMQAGQPVFIKYMFNGWGLKFPANLDNSIALNVLESNLFRHTPMIHGGIIAEGGAFETDGHGTLMSTTQCMSSPNRNPHLSLSETEAILARQLGISKFLWLNHGYLAGDDTDSHIDTLARFCSEDTIAYVSCDDEDDEHFAELKLMEQELQQFRQPNGAPYQLIPLPMAPLCFDSEGNRLPATYANFLIINQAVLLPVYGDPIRDKQAIASIQNCFTDRSIFPIDCRLLTFQHGSLHCVTMQFPRGSLKLK